ncbi:unnamed protein product [Staurois parvus]|uniref:Uncharacterized protein n=1 Tax=Staurois parvus TaxID=386267 RepID=A0ABN9H8S3_9NEOB|nr:unnamed protein product [Staurois parvus]
MKFGGLCRQLQLLHTELFSIRLPPRCHFMWPTSSRLSCCCSQLLLLCYNTTNS